ncbi:Glyoxylase, beta-lactamase superfamily II [Microlunatus sagamiharensis]|uniref:Glyoxylase, beta-lactamase superfamily II n=1 Tax=Microlunatus sagamiharensis TaxID=546874 RepID=A0A1H2MJN3_9ACTN|nr:MBL fold metallo-hydrolase [Microlunatus sagamiharensis]SDU93235.1 Glyoxylase, beta-lactamase superfamily II [Microlunatus sagamiharensis]
MTDAGQDAEPTPLPGPWEELGPGAWRCVAEPDAVNLVLLAGSERALLVDTGSTPAQGRAVRASVASVTDVPLEVVVVTHAHRDHAFGLAAFDDLTTVGHEDVAASLASPDAHADAERLGLAPADLVAPNRPIVLAAAFDLGGRRVEVAHIGRGHTGADLVVVVPDADLVVAGDLVEQAGPPALGPDSYLHEWPVTLDGVIGLMTGATRAVPGHGEPVDRPFVYEQRGRLASVAGQVRHLAETGVGVDEAAEQEWAYPYAVLAAGLPTAFAQLGPVAPRRTLPLA